MTQKERSGKEAFEIKNVDLAGRSGELNINGRKVRTPELMPVVNPNLFLKNLAVPPSELADTFGFQMIITNSYIIRKSPELLERILDRGIHDFMDFQGVIMTDSGTFQSYIYSEGGEVDLDPMEIVEFQESIGSDIGTILDRFTVPESDHQNALEDLETTLGRAKGSLDLGADMTIAVPVQGGRHLDLRKRSGKAVKDLGVKYAPIGGVVPIMESYDYSLLVDVIVASKKGLGPSIPAHLFGAGHPMILPIAVALGCDLFDSSSYAKFAKDDRYMTDHRTYHLKEMDQLPCNCPVCSSKDPSDLRSLPAQERYMELSRHNLWTLQRTLQEIRSAISEGLLWEIVERTAMYNPQLYSAVRRLKEHRDFLEESAPRTTRRFSCSSGLSLARPEFHRYETSLFRSVSRKNDVVMLTDWTRSHSRRTVDAYEKLGEEDPELVVRSPLGPIPYDIMDSYPAAQSIFSDPVGLDPELEDHMRSLEKKFKEKFVQSCIEWDGVDPLGIGNGDVDPNEKHINRISKLMEMQFPYTASRTFDIVFPDPSLISFKRSRKTGRIRNVFEGIGDAKEHMLSLRAEDGHLNLKSLSAQRIHEKTEPPFLRVIVDSETATYNAQGYNVFCKFVKDADSSIRPGDEVLVVDEDDIFQAVGVAAVSFRIMLEGSTGIAVKVREGTKDRVD